MPCALMRSAAWPLTLDTVPLTELHHSLMRTWREETWKGQGGEGTLTHGQSINRLSCSQVVQGTGTLLSNHVARGQITYSETLRILVSHENESSVTKTHEVEMSHCNFLLATYVIAQLHSSSDERRSTSLHNIKWYSGLWPVPVAKGSPGHVLYFCCSQRSESTYPPIPPPPHPTYT